MPSKVERSFAKGPHHEIRGRCEPPKGYEKLETWTTLSSVGRLAQARRGAAAANDTAALAAGTTALRHRVSRGSLRSDARQQIADVDLLAGGAAVAPECSAGRRSADWSRAALRAPVAAQRRGGVRGFGGTLCLRTGLWRGGAFFPRLCGRMFGRRGVAGECARQIEVGRNLGHRRHVVS